ncbi:hypothetical protein ACGFLS_28210 [Streptomyces abikoensis]|uniref:hypothetical protein n=1 Tax=Streptomyces abikoensis TaxID=97398 RepID=UPI00371BD73B
MPDARTDTTEARPFDASAARAAAAGAGTGAGRHRGPASPDDSTMAGAAHGKHRRETD